MKEKILVFLKSKLIGVSESFLSGVADTFSKTIKEEKDIETAITDGIIETLKFSASQLQIEGDRRATEAQKTALKNFQEKHGLDENGKPIEDPTKRGPGRPKKDVDPDPDEPAWFTAFKREQADSVAALKSEIEAQKQEKTLAALSEKVKAHEKLKDIPATFLEDRNLIPKSEAEIDQLADKIRTIYDKHVQSETEKGAYISIPPEGGGAAGDKVTIEDYLSDKFPDESKS